jgi:1,4-alpha-glucan branching enzyme
MFVVDRRMKSEVTRMHTQPRVDQRTSGVPLSTKRRYPIGAELIGANETHFRVWAPKAKHVDVVVEESAERNAKRTIHPLQAEEGGYFSGIASTGAGSLYRFRVDNGKPLVL